MWLVIEYEPVSAFSLRPSNTTSSGGKSLLVPTPYAIKMGILDRVIRNEGLDYGRGLFNSIRDLKIAIRLPDSVAVNRVSKRILRPGGRFESISSVAPREYCFYWGVMYIGFFSEDISFLEELRFYLATINYFGKRGGFVQFLGSRFEAKLPNNFVNLSEPASMNDLSLGIVQQMDDMQITAQFDDISVYSETPASDGGRRSYKVVLSYHLVHHAINHNVYEWRDKTPS